MRLAIEELNTANGVLGRPVEIVQRNIDPETGHVWRVCRLGQIVEGGQFEIVWSNENPIKPPPFPPLRTPQEWTGWLEQLQSGWNGGWENPKNR